MPERDAERWYLHMEGDLGTLAHEESHRPRLAVRTGWEPRVDVVEDAQSFRVRAEVPGVAPNEVEIAYHVETHVLLLRGTRHERAEDLRGRTNVYRLEILTGEFEREIRLPDGPIDSEGIRAVLRDGMITITLPKSNPENEGLRRRTAIVIVHAR